MANIEQYDTSDKDWSKNVNDDVNVVDYKGGGSPKDGGTTNENPVPKQTTVNDPMSSKGGGEQDYAHYDANWLQEYANDLDKLVPKLTEAKSHAQPLQDLRAGIFPAAQNFNNLGAGLTSLYTQNFENVTTAFTRLQTTMHDLATQYKNLDTKNEGLVNDMNRDISNAFTTFDNNIHTKPTP